MTLSNLAKNPSRKSKNTQKIVKIKVALKFKLEILITPKQPKIRFNIVNRLGIFFFIINTLILTFVNYNLKYNTIFKINYQEN